MGKMKKKKTPKVDHVVVPNARRMPDINPTTIAAPKNAKIVDNNARVAHRYYEMLKSLDISRDALNGTSPDEAREIIEERISVLRMERTETERMMSHPIKTVSLAGKEYELNPKTLLKNVEWRRQCSRLMQDTIKDMVKKARPAPKADDSDAGEKEIKESGGLMDKISSASQSSGIDMESLASECVEYVFCEGLDKLVDLMFTYSAELMEDEKDLRATADPCELTDAAMEAFSISIPFAKTVFRGYYRLIKSAGLVKMLVQGIKA